MYVLKKRKSLKVNKNKNMEKTLNSYELSDKVNSEQWNAN